MRIGIDNVSAGESTAREGPGGMRTYLQSLVREFARQSPEHEIVLFSREGADPLLDRVPANVRLVALPGVPLGRPMRVVYQQTRLPSALARHQLDVFFATATVVPLLATVPVVVAVQFLQFYDHPESYGRARSAYLRQVLPLSLRKAAYAIAFTEATRNDLLRRTGVSPDKVRVVPHGLSAELRRRPPPEEEASALAVIQALVGGVPYVVYVSATYGYKNHLRLIRAFARFKRTTGLPHKLLLVGAEVHVPFAALAREADTAGVKDGVVVAGRIPSVAAAYRHAAAAIVPTLYETFGFPVLEAMACGCVTITSNRGSMAELAGDAAVLVDPLDEASIAGGLARALTDASLRTTLVARGLERAAAFTWERSARQTLAVLEEASRG